MSSAIPAVRAVVLGCKGAIEVHISYSNRCAQQIRQLPRTPLAVQFPLWQAARSVCIAFLDIYNAKEYAKVAFAKRRSNSSYGSCRRTAHAAASPGVRKARWPAPHQAEDAAQIPPEDQEGKGTPPCIRLGLLTSDGLPLCLLQLQELHVLRTLACMLIHLGMRSHAGHSWAAVSPNRRMGLAARSDHAFLPTPGLKLESPNMLFTFKQWSWGGRRARCNAGVLSWER